MTTTNHPDPTPPPSEPAPSLRPVEEIRAAADRENAELRGDVAEALKAVEYFDAQSKRRRAERDDLRAQLAAAQVQLAEAQEAIDQSAEVMSSLGGALVEAEARLEAVRALCVIPDWPPRGVDINGRAMPSFVSVDAVLAALSAAPQPEPESLAIDVQHLERQRAWSERTFGPGRRTLGVTDHIRKELKEILDDPGDVKEWVDVVILALDGAWRTDATPAEIIAAIKAKQARNEARTWPDWRTMSPDQAIEHVSEPEPPASDEPARCEHGESEAHVSYTGRGLAYHARDYASCPGPAASGTPAPECRHCSGSGNAHTFDGDDVGICGTCHGTGSAAGGGL